MEFEKHSLILGVIEGLSRHKSWTGKTHLQKALALLDTIGNIQVPFQFVLYKHGPYSFEVEEELEKMKGYGAVVVDPIPSYGVMLEPGKKAPFVRDIAPLSEQQKAAIERICGFIGTRNVADLERIATAAWIRTREGLRESSKVAARLHELKPHVSIDDAMKANNDVDRLQSC